MDRMISGSRYAKKVFILLTVIGFTLITFYAPERVQDAEAADVVRASTPLYFGDGEDGWGVYTKQSGSDLIDRYIPNENISWNAEEKVLTLTNFNYVTDSASQYALVLEHGSTLRLEGSNSLHLERTTENSYGIETWGDVKIEGPGSLSVTSADTTGTNIGVNLSVISSTLTITEATLEVKPGNGVAGTRGLEGTTDTHLVIENGARAFFDGGNITGSSHASIGIFFRHASTSPLSVSGQKTSLIVRGGSYAIKADGSTEKEAPELERGVCGICVYTLYDISDPTKGDQDWWSNWQSIPGYYDVGGRPGPARYVQIAEKPSIVTTELPYGVVNEPYEFSLTGRGERPESFFWSARLQSGSASELGMNFYETGSLLKGTPTQVGKGSITVHLDSDFGRGSGGDFSGDRKTFEFMVYPRAEVHADPTENKVAKNSGVSGSGTKTDPFLVHANTPFTLTANGARQAEKGVVPGDTRFIPDSWRIVSSGTFASKAPYTLSCTLNEIKTYTLTVEYREELWDGSKWVKTGIIETTTATIQATSAPKPDPSKQSLQVARLFGDHRYATSSAVSTYEREAKNVDVVIVASGENANFPDALTASAVSGAENNAPIILTAKTSLSQDAKDAITKLKPSRIIIMGSTAAVSQATENSLKALPSVKKVTRIQGTDRQKTAEAVYKAYQGKLSKTAIIAVSTNFPDSLSISSWAAHTNSPIFLTSGNGKSLTPETEKALGQGGFTRLIIVGSKAVVPNSVITQAKKATGLSDRAVTRLAGTDRYATSLAIAQWTTDAARGPEALTLEKTAIATGETHADALTGGALQGKDTGVLLLTPKASAYQPALDMLSTNKERPIELRFFGGHPAINESVVAGFINALNPHSVTWKPDNTVAVKL